MSPQNVVEIEVIFTFFMQCNLRVASLKIKLFTVNFSVATSTAWSTLSSVGCKWPYATSSLYHTCNYFLALISSFETKQMVLPPHCPLLHERLVLASESFVDGTQERHSQ